LESKKTSAESAEVAVAAPVKKSRPKSGGTSKEPVAPTPRDKGDLSFDAGDYRITPYGIIFFNAFANSDGTNNADDPLWAIAGNRGNTSASGRQTRIGVRIDGGKLAGANVKGVVEADFYGGLPSVGVGENMGVLRLRLAHVRLDWEKTSFLIGQDWVLFAPNSPTSLAAAAIPQFAAAGNPWSRLPQVRVEQKIGKNFKWQGAVLAPGTGDFPIGGSTPVLLQPGTGAASRTPFFQSRFSYANANWFGAKSTGTVGIAVHAGRSKVTNSVVTSNVNSYGLALDWKFPIVKRLTATGEAFFGQNLGGFQAGIFQGYNTDFGTPSNSFGATPGGIQGIRTSGGWLQVGWNIPAFEDRLSIYGSFGIDDPRNGDLITVNGRNFRSRNLGYAFDAIYKISPQFSIGTEFRRLETNYILGNRADSNHFNLGAKYSF